jgi:hypothetical protein
MAARNGLAQAVASAQPLGCGRRLLKLSRRATAAFLVASWLAAGAAAQAREPRLFDSHGLLAIELEARWDPIRRDDSPEPAKHAGAFSYAGPNGAVRIPVEIAASGRSRRTLDICELPPLRIHVPKGDRKGTLLRGVSELKLTTHCKNDANSEQYALLEYLVYRAYGLLTDWSHRVRLVRVRYREPGRERPRWERLGFLIEDASELAKRVGAERVAESDIGDAPLDPEAASRAELFYYMVGMTDFSLIRRDGGPCCHNSRALRRADGSVVPVPYDFDQTGVVNPDYAKPNPRLGIRYVTQRLFRGQCRPAAVTDATLALLREKRAAIEALFTSQPELRPAKAARAVSFLGGFYRWADHPDRVAATLAAECRPRSR